jgi:glycosyltransferase involved in cell wall biosynthesis
MVANLRPLKRPDDAVRAVAAMHPQSGRAVHLALVGGDPAPAGAQTRVLLALAEELGAANRIHCIGQVPSAAPWVVAADACLLCSETEGLSNAVIEYMLGGKPVVCTAVGGNTELIAEGETGFLVPVGDVAAITDRLLRLLDNAAVGARLGAAARNRALAEFSVEGMVGRHVALYERLAAA